MHKARAGAAPRAALQASAVRIRAAAVVGILLALAPAAVSQPDGTVLVPGGTFRMGTSASAIPELKQRYGVGFRGVFEDEVPDHEVTVSEFRLDRTEVTNDRFLRFTVERPEWSRAGIPAALHNGHYLEHWASGRPPEGRGDHPVVFVTWHAAQAFCTWAGGRLPTEAEWEYAARARREHEFPWGDELPSPQRANYAAAGIGDTSAVGRYPPNALGLYDMAGNVWEFALDEWRSGYRAEAQVNPVEGGEVPTDPSTVRGRRVLRGASFGGAAVNLRTRWRDSHEVTNAVAFVGFRCAYPAAGDRR